MILEYAVMAAVSALALDVLCGDPPNRYHPTAWIGRMYGWMTPHLKTDRPRSELILGTATVATVCGMVATMLFAFEYAISAVLTGVAEAFVLTVSGAVLLKTTVAIRGMQRHAMGVVSSIESNDLQCARNMLAMIVKRRTSDLGRGHLISGTLESISENTSDGVTAPLFYFALFGLPGAFVYRAVNTADAMMGYKNSIFSNLGRFAALSDTALNYVPARLTALVMVLAAAALRLDWKNSYRTMVKYGPCTESVNAGYPMAALAGALKITLEKPGHYAICGGNESLQTAHVRTAISVMKLCSCIFCTALVLPAMVLLSYLGWWPYV